MATLDVIILVVYIVAMLVIGFFFGKDNKTQEDYFLGGRSMPWLPVALSVAATMISANAFIGGPGWAYKDGIMPYMQNSAVPLACFFAAAVTVPVFYHLRVTSLYEYMELRLGSWSRMLAVTQFFINSLIQCSSMLFIPALIISTITGWSMKYIVPAIVLCAIIYTIAGGIKAVIWTDTIQMIVLWGGMILICYMAVKGSGGFAQTIGDARSAGKFNAFDFSFSISKTNAFWTTLIGGTCMWIRYFSFDQASMQRILTSKNMHGIKRSYLSSAIMMNAMYFIMLSVGIFLWRFYAGKEFETTNEIMIGFVLNELPIGVVGLIVAAVFAAAMSSVDSILNSMTTVFTKDIYEKFFRKEKDVASLNLTMIVSGCLGVVICFIVLLGFDGSVKSVLDVVGKYISYFSGPALGAFVLAMFTRKAHDKGVAGGFVTGFILGFFIATTFNTSWLWNPAIGSSITFIVGYILSCILPRSKSVEETEQYTAKGIRAKMIAENIKTEGNVSVLPFSIDKFSIGILGVFAAQYIFLAIIR